MSRDIERLKVHWDGKVMTLGEARRQATAALAGAVLASPVDTGRARAPWTITIGIDASRAETALPPVPPPAPVAPAPTPALASDATIALGRFHDLDDAEDI